jgi:heterotetrameric sarcosine oxidase alpha subunit
MNPNFRLPQGGRIDRSREWHFRFDGAEYVGHPGDTLASALLANGVHLVGRSFKYHRPRGIFSAGPEEPNALVTLGTGARTEPNSRATSVELYDGLVARSQNRFPFLRFDLLAAIGFLSPFFPAGFYYKTFMGWPGWKFYERFIRKAAGMGPPPVPEPDPDHYAKRHAHCDVLVIGSGPAGIAAALAAGRAGARVILCDERAEFGGTLLRERVRIAGGTGASWADLIVRELGRMPNLRLLRRTTAFSYLDHNLVALVERITDHIGAPAADAPRQRLWLVRAKQVVLATGAIERPLLFRNNDRPGVMLASAARSYANQYGVLAGRRMVVATNNDDAYRTALDLNEAGAEIAAIIDYRDAAKGALPQAARRAGLKVLEGSVILAAEGRRSLACVRAAPSTGGSASRISCDLLAVSGGWTPSLHLHSQSGGKSRWDAATGAFLPIEPKQASRCIGAANGRMQTKDCLEEGFKAGQDAATAAGFTASTPLEPIDIAYIEESSPAPVALPARSRGKVFVDIQNDVTAADIELAHREGFVSVEHLKRYTTLGMGTDQGKTSNITGLNLLAEKRGQPVPQVGHTTFRPPYTPVTFGAFAGHTTGQSFMPVRMTPMHDWHVAAKARFIDVGIWNRPRCYPRPGERAGKAVRREALMVRQTVGLVDVSTLGRIMVEGPDAATFLDLIYCNRMSSLPVGRSRYGLMLREDGHVLDDGTVWRIATERFYVTTTTVQAARVMWHMEHAAERLWPELKVSLTSMTDAWAAMALAGPRARAVLEAAAEKFDASPAAFPFMAVRDAQISGVAVMVARISFSGELGYEIHCPAGFGQFVWNAVLAAGRPHDIFPYGTEAMGVLRIEKGHVAGPELDGRTTADDLGLGRMVAFAKSDFIGKHLLLRPGMREPARLQLVGLVPLDQQSWLRPGAQLTTTDYRGPPARSIGHVTSPCFSPTLGYPIALALVAGGLARKGEKLIAAAPLHGEAVKVEVVAPGFFDPEGVRLHG